MTELATARGKGPFSTRNGHRDNYIRPPLDQIAARAAAVSRDDKYLESVFKEGLRRHTVG
jgi:hypothetical protein